MKLLTITLATSFIHAASAFVGPLNLNLHATNRPHARSAVAPLEASIQNKGWAAVSGTILAWTLATQIAAASVASTALPDISMDSASMQHNYPTIMLSKGAYQPESGYESLDMTLPSYKMQEISAPKAEESFADPVKEEARIAKLKYVEQKIANKEEAQAKAAYEKQQVKLAKNAAAEAMKAQVAAERQAMKDAKK
eukprot:CAMPEP_0194177460 /NCGR_PEP_ID=MMETSP0154-20130528/11183_1 /TAXON_ID=1049557 /ORGANISM="Thalassiothrix antarctica, Strain L6-D1" /LENGTH=195 /DNA_ID=CAMNT_0038892009 /DNA_START=69 /DNA_END=659 /DNA_ORIENTATION=+